MKISLSALISLNVKRHLSIVLILTFLFSLFTLTLILAPSARAQACGAQSFSTQETINNLNKCAIEKDIFDDKIFNLNQILGTTDSLYTSLTGISLAHPETNQVTQGKGALAGMGGMVAALYREQPVSGVQFFAHEIQKFNPVQPTFAQEPAPIGEIGYDALIPVQKLWRVFRNLSYVGFVIVFVIIGFMIMLRAHISPQAVATIQDSIPRLVVALILVTFSYAIAGLMIDFMFLLLNVVLNFLDAAKLIDLKEANRIAFDQSIIGVIVNGWGSIVSTAAGAIDGVIRAVLDNALDFPIIGDIVGDTLGFIGGIVVAIAMLFVMFRIFLMLLMSYVMIIILTMVAPFFFLIQALPGNNGAKEWFKQMASNVAVFPAVALMIIFAGILGGITAFGGSGDPSALEGPILQFPLLGGGFQAGVLSSFISLGMLLATPEIAGMVKKFISGGQGGGGGFGGAALGGAIGGALGAGYAPVGAALGRAGKAAYESSPVATRLRARQLGREKVAYRKAGMVLPGATPPETEEGAKEDKAA